MFNLFLDAPQFLFLGELGGDMIFVLKIFTLLAIFAFVTQNLGKGPVGILIMLIISWFVIFDYFLFFGGIYVLYMLMALGFSGIIIDFFFVNPGQHGSGEKHPGAPNSGADVLARQNQLQRLRGR